MKVVVFVSVQPSATSAPADRRNTVFVNVLFVCSSTSKSCAERNRSAGCRSEQISRYRKLDLEASVTLFAAEANSPLRCAEQLRKGASITADCATLRAWKALHLLPCCNICGNRRCCQGFSRSSLAFWCWHGPARR